MCLGNSKSDEWEPPAYDGGNGLAPPSSIKVDPLVRLGVVLSFSRDRKIYTQNDPASHLYKVISGAVRTCCHFRDGRRQVGAFYLAGDAFGLELGTRRILSAEAINSSKILAVKRSAIISARERQNDVTFQLWTLTTRELRRAQDHVLLLMKSGPERVASFLLALAERTGTHDFVDLPMPCRDVADYLGLTIETVSRTLTDLRSAGAIELPRAQRVVFQDRAALERLRS
jgi:CRP/FNR family nitrogen fixation transcriptional regulator